MVMWSTGDVHHSNSSSLIYTKHFGCSILQKN